MCGIVGGFWRAPEETHEIQARLSSALEAMRHRGPNDRGLETLQTPQGRLILGQTRLSIIDLSAGGHQPMTSKDGRHCLVFNGEIYNYRELRAELEGQGLTFAAQSDTEVLLTAWQVWGPAVLPRLEGMYSLAVYDRERRRLTLVRDAFGIKPLFYRLSTEGLVFASELPALIAASGQRPEADPQAAYDYLVHGLYDHSPQSFVRGIKHLMPGHLLELDLDQPAAAEPRAWLEFRPKPAQPAPSFTQAAEALRASFLRNVDLHMRADVPLAAALSGGIDSSAVVGAMRHLLPDQPIHTFSFVAANSDISEERWADTVATATGATQHKIFASAEELERDIDRVVRAQGEPFGSTSIYAQYRVFQRAKDEGITVMLEGQGADEMLAGYIGYPGYRLASLWEQGRLAAMPRFAKAWSRWHSQPASLAWKYAYSVLAPDAAYALARGLTGRKAQPDWLALEAFADQGVVLEEKRFVRAPGYRGQRVREHLAQRLTQRGLGHLLRHGDRNAMAHSIENRVPFLTLPLAQQLLELPEDYLIAPDGETKSVFRAAMRGLVPDAVLDRRDKVGFATPERDWFMAMLPTLVAWAEDADAVPFLKRAPLMARLTAVLEGRAPFSWQIWRWINYIRWYRLMIAG